MAIFLRQRYMKYSIWRLGGRVYTGAPEGQRFATHTIVQTGVLIKRRKSDEVTYMSK